MESLAWSQAISSRSPLQPATGNSQLHLIASLDFTAMLSVPEGSLTAPSSAANSEYLVGSSPYEDWESDPYAQSNDDASDPLQSKPASDSAQSDHETDEPRESEDESHNGPTDSAPKSQSSLIEADQSALQPQLDVEANEKAIVDSSNQTQSTDTKNRGFEADKSVSESELRMRLNPRTDDAKIDTQTDSQQGDLKEPLPTAATSVDSGDDSVRLGQHSQTEVSNTPVSVVNSNLATPTSESALISESGTAYDEGAELTPAIESSISAVEDGKGLAIDQNGTDEPRDLRSVAHRKGKSTRWFQRTESELAQKISQDTTHEVANQLGIAGQRMQVGLAGNTLNPLGTTYTTDVGQSPLAQSDPLASLPVGVQQPHILQDQPAAVAQSLSSLTQGALVTSATSIGSEIANVAHQSLGSSQGTEVRPLELGAMDRLHPNANSSATDTSSSGDGLATSNSTSEATSSLVRAERTRMIQRVARSFQRLGNTGGTVQLRLHPPELGSLSMQVQIDGRSMAAQMTTESAAARDVIMDSLPQLRSRLAEQGYEVTQINVDVADPNSSGPQSQWSSFSSSQNGQDGNSQGSRGATSDLRRSAHLRRQLNASPLPTLSTLPQSVSGNRGIDLHA